jgi:hypothetical protein
MPKRRTPLPAAAASGKLDEKTIFSTRHGKGYSKRYAKPKQPNTKAQLEARAAFSWAMRLWQRWLKGPEREAWRAFAGKQKRVDRVTGGVTYPMGHSVFIRHAVHCRRAGYDPPRLPPKGLSPQPISVDLSPKGKGLLLKWDTDEAKVFCRPVKGGEGASLLKVDIRLAVTEAWNRPYDSLYSTIAIVPFSDGRYLFSPVKSGKHYSFAIRVLTPDGQASRPFRTSLILE